MTWAYLERVTRIELALSAWEPQRLGLPGALTSQVGWPLVAVDRPLVTLVNGTLMARQPGSIGELRQEFEILYVGEDAIVRHKRHLEPDSCRRHPAVRFVVFLAQAVSGPDTPCTERGISLGKTWSRPDDLCSRYLILQPPEPFRAPPGQPGAITKLGDGDERNDGWPTLKDRTIPRRQ